MTLAKVLLQSAGLLPVDATERDPPRNTRSKHPKAASSSGNSTPMPQSAPVKDTDMIDPTCEPVKDTHIIDPTCDVVLGLLLFLSGGFSVHPEGKAAIAMEVLINKSIHCTHQDMDMLAKVVNIMMADLKGSPKDPKKNFGIYATM